MIHAWLELTFLKMGFWITWTIVPVLVEIIPAIYAALNVYFWGKKLTLPEPPEKLPLISIIVPVYNSEDTLYACLDSIDASTYPNSRIQVIVSNNQSTDNSFQVFGEAQNHFKTMHLSIVNADKGKARALNVAMYNAEGSYIINIDSDGRLEPNALMNMVLRFEANPHIAAMTGTILSQKQDILATKKRWLRILQKNEYFEYAQAFLSGRTVESNKNQLFTMSGAFSAFRRDVIFNTFMYNTETVGEDTEMTFQIRQRLGDRVELCPDALFYIEPISGYAELYTQRQRWQRGELETTHRYSLEQVGLHRFFHNFLIRRLMLDHTFMFPRMIWMFASVILLFLGYSPIVLLASYVLIYCLYILVEIFNFVCVRVLLEKFDEERHFYDRQWWAVFTLPMYNLFCFAVRLIGTINMMVFPSVWNSRRPEDEWTSVQHATIGDWQTIKARLRHWKIYRDE